MATPQSAKWRSKVCSACGCAALLATSPVFAQSETESELGASELGPPELGPQEEILEDGQIVTRILPEQNPLAQPETRKRGEEAQAAPAPSSVPPSVPSVLAILSHPDDELIIAPILARIARERGEVTLVFATSGDAGPGQSGLEMGKELADLRENEARCSAFALGLDEPIFWRLGDGTLANQARNSQSKMRDMGERIAGLIAVHEPSVVMTWGPDGGYGHADHRITSNAVTQIVQAMGPARPDLLYAAFPAASDPGSGSDADDLPGFDGWARLHPSLITDKIRYELPDLDATIAAVDCYESQFDAAARRVLAGTLHERVWRGSVAFRLAFARRAITPTATLHCKAVEKVQ